MAKKNGFGKAAGIIAGLLVFFVVVLTGINVLVAPIIESNGSAQQYAPLYAVMADAKEFETIYDVNDAAASTLADVPETVQAIYKETSGLGYALRLSTTKGYTGDAIEITLAVDAEGKISGIELNAYPETKDFGADYPATYVGQDSALGDVTLVAGVTYSSSAFKGAVEDGMNTLVNNGLMSAGEKSDAQLLKELLPTVFSGIANKAGVLQVEELDVAGQYTYTQTVLKALNNSGFAFIMVDGETTLMAVCNAKGGCAVYDAEGNDVTADNAAMVEEAVAYTTANIVSGADKALAKLQNLAEGEFTELPLDGVFNSVTDAYEIKNGEETLYGFVSRSYGYSNIPMEVFYVLDAEGAIVAMTATELIIHPEYFNAYTLDETSYKEGFKGLTADTWTADKALISGATITTESIQVSTEDVFAAFQTIQENGGEANE